MLNTFTAGTKADPAEVNENFLFVLGEEFDLTDGATIAIDWENGSQQRVTLAGNRTLTFDNPQEGAQYRLFLTQDATGGRTIVWPTVRWQGGSAPTLTTTAAKTDLISLWYSNGQYFGRADLNF